MGKNTDKNARRNAVKEQTKKVRKKVCTFCARHEVWIDYKDTDTLKRYMSDRGKIRARRVTGNCVQHQSDIAVAIKTARELALLPYTERTPAERSRSRSAVKTEVEETPYEEPSYDDVFVEEEDDDAGEEEQ
ncbi:Ribosomal protein S18 [Ferrithrix thermotolerans DSM 19514]|jgi:small subunit ribosomal protein S18|uniref:Small ribosomal subunit protein bS18 n=1 Tax=Ferrithrix thermotolerans DSM 19514 TaxID=1121881 RepID=A0A1M4WYS9_9ACTN|nr:Ribosomal protein S18 [Ferrithrix thermotolerans DSM 19514]